jgi:palmitoyltransferase ZDHHC9/14/18
VQDGTEQVYRVRRRWCYTCHILRPARASHCPYCDCCIDRMDHHCPWTGTCIGGRNYRFFYGFISTAALLAVYSVACCIAAFVINAKQVESSSDTHGMDAFWEGAGQDHYLGIVVVIYSSLLFCCVGSLAFYHTKLVCDNATTHEKMKGLANSRHPWDAGCSKNTRAVLCSPRMESLVPSYLSGALTTPHPVVPPQSSSVSKATAHAPDNSRLSIEMSDGALSGPTPEHDDDVRGSEEMMPVIQRVPSARGRSPVPGGIVEERTGSFREVV